VTATGSILREQLLVVDECTSETDADTTAKMWLGVKR
jgi:hypothetical protein